MILARTLKAVLPRQLSIKLSLFLSQLKSRKFFNQKKTYYRSGCYDICAPRDHPIISILKRQPYRDLCIGITAKFIADKYPKGVIVDIGANIGDTAAIIASYASNKLILIEASDFFQKFLVENVRKLPNDVSIIHSFIGDGSPSSGGLVHWGGTAYFGRSGGQDAEIQTRRLQDVVGEDVCFIKVDTDGFDAKIINSSLEYLSRNRPALIFENQVTNASELAIADTLCANLVNVGYSHFIIWDDPGFYITSTSSLSVLKDFNRYLFKMWSSKDAVKSVSNFDVLCLGEKDIEIFELVREYYRSY
jgi:FkbM family methyltransferase